ncbi:hypothetical protein [Streptomyces sp. NPDC092307]|uniref:hypothetical protein n=1 Tax=Streptomyces sp. NPDC092307 TaxID=3366013 RepID=UPI00382A3899
MTMNKAALANESADLLPSREALGRLRFGIGRTTVTKAALVGASNSSGAANYLSDLGIAHAHSSQTIVVNQ